MKRIAKLTVGLAAGGVLITGGLLGAGSVFASEADEPTAGAKGSQTQSEKQECSGPGGKSGHSGEGMGEHGGEGMGKHSGEGAGEHGGEGTGKHGGEGTGEHAGEGTGKHGGITAESGKLTDAQKTTLAAMAEEEKLAYDLYTSFADRYDTHVFDRIRQSECHHLDVVRTLLDRYGVDDPTKGQKAGSFADEKTQKTYDRLLGQGKASEDKALKAGRTVEKTDINDLTKALKGLDAPDVEQVYERLIEASEKHLSAFERQLGA
jgi:hypothetical protein